MKCLSLSGTDAGGGTRRPAPSALTATEAPYAALGATTVLLALALPPAPAITLATAVIIASAIAVRHPDSTVTPDRRAADGYFRLFLDRLAALASIILAALASQLAPTPDAVATRPITSRVTTHANAPPGHARRRRARRVAAAVRRPTTKRNCHGQALFDGAWRAIPTAA